MSLKFRSKFSHSFTNHGCLLFCYCRSFIRWKKLSRQKLVSLSIKMFNNMKVTRAACWINLEIGTEAAASHSWHCVKNFRLWSYSGPDFSAFGTNTERYKVSPRIQSECGKMQTRITPNADTFSRSVIFLCY